MLRAIVNSLALGIILLISASVGFGQDNSADLLQQYRKEIAENPRNSLAHYRAGEILLKQKNYQPAANEFLEALRGDLHPAWTGTLSHISLGQIFEQSGQYDRAMKEFKQAKQSQLQTLFVCCQERIEGTKSLYTEEASLAEIEGTVVVSGLIGDDGSPSQLRAILPLGLGLDEKAVDAVKDRFSRLDRSRTRETGLTNIAVDFTLPQKSRWHLIMAEFDPPEGASRPTFSKVHYPPGAGLETAAAIDQGRVLGANRTTGDRDTFLYR